MGHILKPGDPCPCCGQPILTDDPEALDKLGAHVARYCATEIDKYAIKTTQHNFPDTIQLGDAYQVRDAGWSLPEEDL